VLQEKTIERVGSNRATPVDVRVVAATHRDLPTAVSDGSFREDLYYRLAVMVLEVPPLRHRRADIPLLADHFRRQFLRAGGEDRRFSREAMDRLMRYDYPGNVRELRNIVERALALARDTEVTTGDLPAAVTSGEPPSREPGSLPEKVSLLEREAIDEALATEDGNQSAAARRLGISERVLRYKIEKYGLR
jgi:DNA-binding NtrC family response regulator